MSDDTFDPYAILGIGPDAGSEAIRQAWREAARQHHPDTGGDAEMFKLAQRAFRTLVQGGGRRSGGEAEPDLAYDPHVVHDGETGGRVVVEVMVDHRVAVFGGLERVTRWRLIHCPACSGRGDRCETCHGEGRVGRYHSTVVHIPERSTHGDIVSIYQGGDAGPRRRGPTGRATSNTGPFGDLDVRILVDTHPRIGESGDDLVTEIQVDMYDAALGCSVSVHGLDGAWTVLVPAGTQPGTRLRVPGKGRPKIDSGRGDLVVVVDVRIPEQLDALERIALHELRSSRSQGRHPPTTR